MPPDTAKPQQNEEVIDSFKRITTFASDIDLTREISASHTLRIPNTEFLSFLRGSVYYFALRKADDETAAGLFLLAIHAGLITKVRQIIDCFDYI